MNLTRLKQLTLARFSAIAFAVFALVSAVAAQSAQPTIYKIAEAGVQIDLPPGWDAEKVPNGTYTISKKDSGGYMVFSVIILTGDPNATVDSLFAVFAERIFEHAQKDWKDFKPGALIKDTTNGMAVRAQSFEGSRESGDLEGLIMVIDSPKPIAILGQRRKKQSDLLEKEGPTILGSIKKIQ